MFMIDYGQFGNQLKQVKRMPELTTCPLTAGRWWKSEDIAACAPPSSTPAAAPGPSPSPPPGPRYATVTHQTWWWVRPSTEEDILKSSTQVWAIGNIILQQQSYRAALKIYILGKGGSRLTPNDAIAYKWRTPWGGPAEGGRPGSWGSAHLVGGPMKPLQTPSTRHLVLLFWLRKTNKINRHKTLSLTK